MTEYEILCAILDSGVARNSPKGFLEYNQLGRMVDGSKRFFRGIGRQVFKYAMEHPGWDCSEVRRKRKRAA
jgi:hypothetical protein